MRKSLCTHDRGKDFGIVAIHLCHIFYVVPADRYAVVLPVGYVLTLRSVAVQADLTTSWLLNLLKSIPPTEPFMGHLAELKTVNLQQVGCPSL